MAAAMIALVLEAKPSLTWRDVQHIIVRTSRPANLRATDWQTNGMGRKVSHSYGYGLMDTAAMARAAKEWTLVPRQEKCLISSTMNTIGMPIVFTVEALQINESQTFFN